MHEMSLVKNLLSQVRSIVADNGAERAEEIVIEIGPLSGVEIELVKSAYAELIGDMRSGATLTIEETPLVIRCRKCGLESQVQNFVFRCKHCDSGRVRVIRGDEFRLLSVTLNKAHSHAG